VLPPARSPAAGSDRQPRATCARVGAPAGTLTRVTSREQAGAVLTQDERLLVLAAHGLGLLRASSWPDVAAQLLVRGVETEATVNLASLSRYDSPWVIDPLVSDVVAELGDLAGLHRQTLDEQSRLVGRAIARVAAGQGLAQSLLAVRTLGSLSPLLDYPSGLIGEAYYASEWLDCACHEGSAERAAAAALEDALRDEPLDADEDLLAAVAAGWL
jgi:hypothetical protein